MWKKPLYLTILCFIKLEEVEFAVIVLDDSVYLRTLLDE